MKTAREWAAVASNWWMLALDERARVIAEIQEEARTEARREHLRDQFAAAALTGLLSSDWSTSASVAADSAYELADAMLAAREQKPETK